MKLEVIVYSDEPKERSVYINGRWFVEGQNVDGRFTVDTIQSNGVYLKAGGERHFLRP